MTIPLWLAGIFVAAILGQFIAGAAWLIRSDRDRAVESAERKADIGALTREVARLSTIIEAHNPIAVRGEIDSMLARLRVLDEGHKAHHQLLRELQRRMDRAHFPDVHTDAGGNGA